MKKGFNFLLLLFVIGISLALIGDLVYTYGDFEEPYKPSWGEPLSFGIYYKISSDLCTDTKCGFTSMGQEIPITVQFYKTVMYDNNIKMTVLESEYYEIVGQSEFNFLDYEYDETGCTEVVFTVKITKLTLEEDGKTYGVRGIGLRFYCLCDEEKCKRFIYAYPNHYYEDLNAFGFVSKWDGVYLSYNHDIEGYSKDALYQESIRLKK